MSGLTEKERLVLQKIADGEIKKVIAQDIGTSYPRLKNMLQQMREKLDAPTNENAVAIAIRQELID